MAERTVRSNLNVLEEDYRSAFTRNDEAALQRLQTALATLRYELRMDAVVQLEYPHDDEPLVMRILTNERDLDRWIGQRFMRLIES